MERVSSRGNLVLALIAGFAAAFIGALLWIAITLSTGWNASLVALGVGLMVGLAIRMSGRGSHFIYGVLGAGFTLLGCLAGQMGVALQLATNAKLDLYAVLTRVDLVAMASAIVSHASPMMMVVCGIGAFEAYQLSIRK